MLILSWITETAVTFAENIICLLCACALFSKTDTGKADVLKIVALSCISTAAITYCNSINIVSRITLFLSIIILSGAVYFVFKKPYVYCIVLSASYMTVLVVTEMFFISCISVVTSNPDFVSEILTASTAARMAYIIFMKLVNLALYLFLKNLLKKTDYTVLNNPVYILSVCISLTAVLIMMRLISENNSNSLRIGISVLFIVYLFLISFVVYLINVIAKNKISEEEQNYMIFKNQMLESNIITSNKIYEEGCKKIHDFKHHIDALRFMLDNRQYEQMRDYMSKISEVSDFIPKYSTGNETIDFVLNAKKTIMDKNNISFSAEIYNAENIDINPSDLCSLLLNLLDNAIEANARLKNKKIEFFIKSHGNIVVINVFNNCEPDVDINNLNSKKGKGHGWGLKIINDIVEKYNGKCYISTDSGAFITKIILFGK